MIRKNGVKVIEKTVGKFQGIVDNLDKGIGLCDAEIGKNTVTIEVLGKKNKNISTSKAQAETFRDNLKTMLSGKIAEKDEKDEKNEKKKD